MYFANTRFIKPQPYSSIFIKTTMQNHWTQRENRPESHKERVGNPDHGCAWKTVELSSTKSWSSGKDALTVIVPSEVCEPMMRSKDVEHSVQEVHVSNH
jgi:hypothetical protein